LDILVPQYMEDETVIRTLLDSIELQQSVDLENDIGVIIVNDGSDVRLSQEFLDKYTFPITYRQHRHRGVSATRNSCLDYSTAEYVIFCDADDCLFNALGLWMLLKEIDKGFDTLVSTFLEENHRMKNGETVYLSREKDNVFVHGKVHRRQYLIDKGIRWNESLTIHEDSYFNTLCQTLTDKAVYMSTPFYLWRWREASVCRHDPKYSLKTYNNLLDSNDALVDEFLRRGMNDKAIAMAVMMIFNSYYTMAKPDWVNQENKEYRDKVEKRFAEYFRKHKDLWESIDPQKKMVISNNVRTRSVGEGMQMETMTLEQWLADKG